jgi:hypothetical protein
VTAALTIREVEGWPLGFDIDDEPRIRDLDLADRLGYERPRKIRDLIARLILDEKLNDIHQRPTVGRWPGQVAAQPVTEYWLTEAQALKVAAKSETEPADALLDEMIRVFLLARRGQLKVVVDDASLFAVAEVGSWRFRRGAGVDWIDDGELISQVLEDLRGDEFDAALDLLHAHIRQRIAAGAYQAGAGGRSPGPRVLWLDPVFTLSRAAAMDCAAELGANEATIAWVGVVFDTAKRAAEQPEPPPMPPSEEELEAMAPEARRHAVQRAEAAHGKWIKASHAKRVPEPPRPQLTAAPAPKGRLHT